MESKRMRKLLRSREYGRLARESILVESPFAETTEDGWGLREVALALTKKRLIVAADVFPEGCSQKFWCPRGVDPSIETLELVSIYPLDFITLSVFRRTRRKTLRARFDDGRAKYYELGGMERRDIRWSLWCQEIQRLSARKDLSNSPSNKTVAISSSYPMTSEDTPSSFDGANVQSSRSICKIGRDRCAGGGDGSSRTWKRKDLYLGPGFDELQDGSYKPVPLQLIGGNFETIKSSIKDYSPRTKLIKRMHEKQSANHCKNCHCQSTPSTATDDKDSQRSFDELLDCRFEKNRSSENYCSSVTVDIEVFESVSNNQKTLKPTIPETLIYLRKKIIRHLSRFNQKHEKNRNSGNHPIADPCELIESGVSLWENATKRQNRSTKRYLRRSGISTATYFLHALGPWSVQPGDRESLQNRRSHSCVAVRRQAPEPELRLPVSRRQLASSISLTNVSNVTKVPSRGRVVLFWTPDYWYRPRAAAEAYRDARRHLERVRRFRVEREQRKLRRKIFARKRKSDSSSKSYESSSRSAESAKFHDPPKLWKRQQEQRANETGTTYLRKLLKLEFRVSLSDLDSSTVARQLTLVDRELFLRVPRRELEIVARQGNSRDAPNIAAWIAFAYRISCLTASEVLAAKKVDTRARFIVRLLNAAEKCYVIGNFHSTRSILAGLQSPAIYRLKETWAYLKRHHATTYEVMEKLCKIFKSTRTKRYCKAWMKAEKNPPMMPFVGHVLMKVLGVEETITVSNTTDKSLHKAGAKQIRQRQDTKKWNFSTISDEITFLSQNPQQWSETADWLEYCQSFAKNYEFPGHSLAWEFLLKARYHEDRENFFKSLEIEPATDS